jgi:hyperosmotically inducible periplasmic protein
MSRHPIGASLTLGAVFLAAVAVMGCGDSASSSATNTSTNVRDREGKTATPEDQSNKSGDVEVTARIRKALVADDSLSTNAKNVKIVTENGGVTLRGPVNDARERETVVRLAKQEVGQRNVVDQLDVAQP